MLSDKDILDAMKHSEIKITNFDENSLTPNGYDLRIGELMIPEKNIHLKEGEITIPPLTRFLVGTKEEIQLSPKYTAEIWIKSRWARRGVLASFGLVDAGFRGILTLGAFATGEIKIEIGEKFAQISFFELKNPAKKDYAERSGNYQNQKSIEI